MGQLRADLRELDFIDIQKQGAPIHGFPARKRLQLTEEASLKSAIEFASYFHSDWTIFLDAVDEVGRPEFYVYERFGDLTGLSM